MAEKTLFPFPENEIIKKEEPFEVPEEEPFGFEDPTAPFPFEPLTGAVLSEDRVYRYTLWRRFKEAGTSCLFIGVNPSTADETENDPTIIREESFAKAWGHAMLVKVNLFGYRATDPKVMRKAAKEGYDVVGPENDRHVIEQCSCADMIVCAWGNNGLFKGRDRAVMDLLINYDLYCLGVTKRGAPKHTLFLKKSSMPQWWKPKEEAFTV